MATSKRALVLSGGGGRGGYECGVYKYLEQIGWEPDILVGTSIGAINAAAIASGRSAAQLEAAWLDTHTRDIQRFFRFRSWNAIFDTAPWRKTLYRYVDFEALAETDKHLMIAATQIESGDLRIFDNQKETLTLDHIMASSSIPIVYPCTEIEGHHYWDGAVMANTPLAAAIDAGADEVFIVLLSPIGERHMESPRSPWQALTVVLDLLLSASYENDIKQLENGSLGALSQKRPIDYRVIAPSEETSLLRIVRYTPEVSKNLIDMGYQDAQRILEDK